MRNLHHANAYLFYMNANFKIYQLGYPLIVCGVSDQTRVFHFVTLMITTQPTKACQTSALENLFNTYRNVVGGYTAIRFFMGDADTAQLTAFSSVAGAMTGVRTSCVITTSSTTSSRAPRNVQFCEGTGLRAHQRDALKQEQA